MKFNYYTGMEAEQFAFFRIPRMLIRDRRFSGLSSNAKLLYGLMLDRLSLSMKNGWIDDDNRAYIYYAVENIMEELNCAKSTCIRILAELDDKKGIGLIERVRQGQGRPDRIYVKNFASIQTGGNGDGGNHSPDGEDKSKDRNDATESKTECVRMSGEASGFSCAGNPEDTDSILEEQPESYKGADRIPENQPESHEKTDGESGDTDTGQAITPERMMSVETEDDHFCCAGGSVGESSRSSKIGLLKITEAYEGDRQISVYSESDFRNARNENPRSSKIGLLEVAKSAPNYTNNNQTDYSQTEGESIHPIYPINPNLENADEMSRDVDGAEGSDCTLRDWGGGMERASPETDLQRVRKNIEYDHFLRNLSLDELTIFQEIDLIIRDILFAKGGMFRINGVEYAPEYVREKVLGLNCYHIEYILECVKDRTNVRNIRAYMLTTIINAITTMDHSYQQQIRRDAFCGW